MNFATILVIFLILFSCQNKESHMELKDKLISFPTSNNINLNGYITYKENQTGKSPAIILFEGSGQSPRDEEKEDEPFRLLAHFLANQGFVTFRYNKRGSGYNKNNGDFSLATIATNLEDARSALKYISKHEYVDSNRIYVFGQSMGGTRATALAAENKNIKGVILFASPSFSPKNHSFIEFNNEQMGQMLKYAYKFTDEQINKELANNTRMFKNIKNGTFKCEDFTDYKLVKCEERKGQVFLDGMTIDYFKEALNYDQMEVLEKVNSPVLIIQGTSDWIVPEKNATLAAETLKKAKKNFKLELIKELDHVFAENKTIKDSVDYMMAVGSGKANFKPPHEKFLNVLLKWLQEN